MDHFSFPPFRNWRKTKQKHIFFSFSLLFWTEKTNWLWIKKSQHNSKNNKILCSSISSRKWMESNDDHEVKKIWFSNYHLNHSSIVINTMIVSERQTTWSEWFCRCFILSQFDVATPKTERQWFFSIYHQIECKWKFHSSRDIFTIVAKTSRIDGMQKTWR